MLRGEKKPRLSHIIKQYFHHIQLFPKYKPVYEGCERSTDSTHLPDVPKASAKRPRWESVVALVEPVSL